MNGANGGENTEQSRRQDDRPEARVETPRDPSERLLLPVATETSAEDTCTAVRPYVDPRHSELVAVHVIEKTEGFPDKLPPSAARERAEVICRIVHGHFADADYQVATEVRYGPNVVEEIIDTAEAIDATAIGFTPRQGRRWMRLLAGDVGYRLVTSSHRPVMVFPRPTINQRPPSAAEGPTLKDLLFDDVVLPVVSTNDAEATCQAVLPYLTSESRVAVVHVLRGRPQRTDPRGGALAETRERSAQQLLERVSEWLESTGISTATRLEYAVDVVGAINGFADEEDADVIVFTPRDVARWKRLLSGDVGDKLIRRSNRPVVVLPVKNEDEHR